MKSDFTIGFVVSAGRLLRAVLLVGAVGFASGCDDDDAPAPTPTAPAPTPTPAPAPEPEPTGEDTAVYTFSMPEVFISERIPGSLPPGVTFAPPLALIAHPREEPLFELGGTASDGLKRLAEIGASGLFIEEARARGHEVLASNIGELLAILLAPEPRVAMHRDRPCLTLAQMVEPTPDWFAGFSNVCAIDEDGNWLEEVTATSIAYDAGTAEGNGYAFKAPGGDTEPREPITLLDVPPFSPPGTPTQINTATRVVE